MVYSKDLGKTPERIVSYKLLSHKQAQYLILPMPDIHVTNSARTSNSNDRSHKFSHADTLASNRVYYQSLITNQS